MKNKGLISVIAILFIALLVVSYLWYVQGTTEQKSSKSLSLKLDSVTSKKDSIISVLKEDLSIKDKKIEKLNDSVLKLRNQIEYWKLETSLSLNHSRYQSKRISDIFEIIMNPQNGPVDPPLHTCYEQKNGKSRSRIPLHLYSAPRIRSNPNPK